MSSTTSYATVARTTSPTPAQKYVPVHRRTPSEGGSSVGRRSPSPTPSDASTSTSVSNSRVYSIASLLQLAHQPEVKVIALEQKEKLREVLPEIVISRRMRKAMEYHAIQEKVSLGKSSPVHVHVPVPVLQVTPTPTPTSTSTQRSRPGQRRTAGGVDRRRNAVKVVDEVGWRALRPVTRVVSPTA